MGARAGRRAGSRVMDEGRRNYLLRYKLPIHTATRPCHPGHDGVTPLSKMAPGRLLASRIGSILVSTDMSGERSGFARNP
jgi:hypothetical protein